MRKISRFSADLNVSKLVDQRHVNNLSIAPLIHQLGGITYNPRKVLSFARYIINVCFFNDVAFHISPIHRQYLISLNYIIPAVIASKQLWWTLGVGASTPYLRIIFLNDIIHSTGFLFVTEAISLLTEFAFNSLHSCFTNIIYLRIWHAYITYIFSCPQVSEKKKRFDIPTASWNGVSKIGMWK